MSLALGRIATSSSSLAWASHGFFQVADLGLYAVFQLFELCAETGDGFVGSIHVAGLFAHVAGLAHGGQLPGQSMQC